MPFSVLGVRGCHYPGSLDPGPETPRAVSGTLISLCVCVLLCPEGFEMVSYLTEHVVSTFLISKNKRKQ